jgi:hypothetical protein
MRNTTYLKVSFDDGGMPAKTAQRFNLRFCCQVAVAPAGKAAERIRVFCKSRSP